MFTENRWITLCTYLLSLFVCRRNYNPWHSTFVISLFVFPIIFVVTFYSLGFCSEVNKHTFKRPMSTNTVSPLVCFPVKKKIKQSQILHEIFGRWLFFEGKKRIAKKQKRLCFTLQMYWLFTDLFYTCAQKYIF